MFEIVSLIENGCYPINFTQINLCKFHDARGRRLKVFATSAHVSARNQREYGIPNVSMLWCWLEWGGEGDEGGEECWEVSVYSDMIPKHGYG